MVSFTANQLLAVLQPAQATDQEARNWNSVGHEDAWDWVFALQRFAPLAMLALIAVLLVMAFRNRQRYRAVETLDLESVEKLRRSVARAETETVGEIGVVVLERSDRHPEAPWVGAVFLTILGTLSCSHLLVQLPIATVLTLQFFFGLGMYWMVGAVPDLRRRFVRRSRASEMAEEQAIQEFHALRLRDTVDRSGVLLFVSLFERQVVVLADEGISDQVDAKIWIEVDGAILSGAKSNQLRAGLENGIQLVGNILKGHFPAESGGDNQVVDHVIVRRE